MINEYVRLNSDMNYIRQKWVVIHAQIGTSLADTYIWIKSVSHGCDTESNLTKFKYTSDGYNGTANADGRYERQNPYKGVDKTGIVGIIGEYRVVKLSDVSPFVRGGKIDFVPNIELG